MTMELGPIMLDQDQGKRREIILRELQKRTLWFIQLRWLVPPAIILGSGVAVLIGVKFAALAVVLVGLYILAYNAVFFFVSRRKRNGRGWDTARIKAFTYWQVSLDYTAMFLLIHFTGGVASPLIFFFIFHVIFASILLPPRSAYGFAGLAASGMAVIAAAEYFNFFSHHPLMFQGRAINLAERPFHVMVELGFFTASVFITAFATTALMPTFRTRIHNLAELSEAVVRLNDRLNALYQITQSATSTNRFQQVLDIVTAELTKVMNVKGIAVKLLSEDKKTLSYASVHGLPPEFIREHSIELDKSPINRRVIEAEPFAIGHVSQADSFQFGEDLTAAGIKSVMFTALSVEGRVIGILSAYSTEPDAFGVDELDFFRLAAGLTAVALENARIFEAIEQLVKERSWFMMRVAHHFRSPLTAIISIVNTMLGGYLGAFNDEQLKYLERIERRSEAMMKMISELMTLAQTRSKERLATHRSVDLQKLIAGLRDAFQAEASTKGLDFTVTIAPDLPAISGDAEMLEQLFENLASNAIKYTLAGGRVRIEAGREGKDMVRLVFADSGIGIPKDAQPRLFTEFFRADNAKKLEETGTGLGLSIVKDTVQQHQGSINVASEEGEGSTFTVLLPIGPRPPDPPDPPAKTS